MKILIIEDENEILKLLTDFVRNQKYICESAHNFQIAKEKLSVYKYDIVLLDITLPDGNGLQLIETIKKYNPKSGIIIISAKNSLNDKITGLDTGADDYMTKPFQLSELNSRIKAVLRRNKYSGSNIVQFNEITINTESNEVRINDTLLSLTKKEYDILLYFIINQNRVLTREAIAEHLWNDNVDLADNFDFIYTHINNLRKKIKQAKGKNYIKNHYGVGYKFSNL